MVKLVVGVDRFYQIQKCLIRFVFCEEHCKWCPFPAGGAPATCMP